MLSGAAVVATAGCNESEGGDVTATLPPGATATTTEPDPDEVGTATAQLAFPNYEWDKLDGMEPVATSTVTFTDNNDFEFEPAVIRVPPGTEITFENEQNTSHVVNIPGIDYEQRILGGFSVSVTIDEAGTYLFVCEEHSPDEAGRVEVVEGATLDGGDGGGTDAGTDTDAA